MDGGENISDTEYVARSIKRAARRVQDFIRKRRGGGAGELTGLQVDDSAPAFPLSLVDMGSWNRLRECCSLHKIKQTDLRRLYDKYEHLLYADKHPDGRRKRKMRLSLYAFQDEYDHMPIEMVSLIYIPTIFIENVPGLRAPDDEHQVDFARFVIAARSTIERKASRGSAHRQQSVFAFTVAARGVLYISASSPNEPPASTSFTITGACPIANVRQHCTAPESTT